MNNRVVASCIGVQCPILSYISEW